jgi:hypothetical protein
VGGWAATAHNGYKWIFYATTIFSALVQGLGLILLRETYHPVLLNQQASQIKKSMGLPDSSDKVQTIFEVKGGGKKKPADVFKTGMVRPFVLFYHEPIIQVQACYMSLLYGVRLPTLSTFSSPSFCELTTLLLLTDHLYDARLDDPE